VSALRRFIRAARLHHVSARQAGSTLQQSGFLLFLHEMEEKTGKKIENFKAAVALNFSYYNSVKAHGAWKTTPAMAAGIEKSHWTVAELAESLWRINKTIWRAFKWRLSICTIVVRIGANP